MPKQSQPLDVPARIRIAKERTGALEDNALVLISLFEANEIIVFSDTLSKQVTDPYAANAFDVFQEASFMFEVIRLCAFWDSRAQVDVAYQSIPTVIQLIDFEPVIRALREETRLVHYDREPARFSPSIDPTIRALEISSTMQWRQEFAERQAAKAERRLRTSIAWSRRILQSDRLTAMRNFRDKHLAHSLSYTRRDQEAAARGTFVVNMKYADARWLYRRTLAIINNLQLGINGFGLDRYWIGISRHNARELWTNCTFNKKQP
jgi:hypothetical protein